ncbi:hypothetical protein [Clostridium manihotivorum]|uniref:Uncharacterized protein n=1 Tax=Clostridium manihotivorum TaxID=2320868 RepID=A0A410DQ46_9CLOT|nr:hypothetical protein [Clostridium manihotivorum]QAA31167.1 hypothetical protein C1I91_05520 [Clostridium manihotivorum]
MRRKKGSTLVTVVVLFAVVFTVGTAVLSMTVVDYKSRITESKRIEHLYGADSGIDTAYNIAGSVIKLAITQGNSAAESHFDSGTNSINSILDSEISKMRNNQTCAYPRTGAPTKSRLINDDYTANDDGIKSLLNDYFKPVYKSFIEQYLLNCIREKKTIANLNAVNDTDKYSFVHFNTDIEPRFDESDFYGVDSSNQRVAIGGSPVRYKLNLVSVYQDNNGNEARKVSAVYYIDIPNYSGTYGKKSVTLPMNGVIKKAIAADGDLIIDSVNTANVSGDVFIKGSDNTGSGSIAYTKYSGGIAVNNSVNVNFYNGKVVTSRTFRLLNNANNVNVTDDNLYASNIYVGKDENGSAYDSHLNVTKAAIIDNDLAMNATSSYAHLNGGLYAISDIRRTDYAKAGAKEKSSSSIIMNSTDDSSEIIVNGKAYIMGTAYINTSEAYQTGESVAVKGNYNAYATMIPQDGADYLFKYYNPLTLIDKKDITVFDKAAHFYNYATNSKYNGSLNITKKISLPTNNNSTISVGAFISNGIVYKSNYTDDSSFQSDLLSKQYEFAQQVYEMGNVPTTDTVTLSKDYNNGAVVKNVSNQINLPQNNSNVDYTDISNDSSNNCIIINTNPNKRIFIKGKNYSFKETPVTTGSNPDIVIDRQNNQNMSSVIISAGDVYLSGNISYTGTIITKGNVKIQGRASGENISITQNSDIVNKICTKYYSKLKSILNISDVNSQIASNTLVVSDSVQNAVNLNDIIHKGLWKIER